MPTGKRTGSVESRQWDLRLYVAGDSPRSILARANLKQLCAEYLKDDYRIEEIDLLDEPGRSRQDQIIAVPTLVRVAPTPVLRIVGDLSDRDKVVAAMQFPIQRRDVN